MSSSSVTMDMSESTILDESSRYKENKETFQALQGLSCKLKHGINYGQRIVMCFRASLILNRSFNELIKIKDSFRFLELAATSDCDQKLLVMSDIIEAMDMTNHEVAQFVSKEITASIIKTRFSQFTKDAEMSTMSSSTSMSSSWSASRQVFDDIWNFSLSKELHLILELCKGKTTLLGNYLLKYYKILSRSSVDIPLHWFGDTKEDEELEKICIQLNRSLNPQVMSLKKQNIIRVELLLVAHECFCYDCSTEGIGEILNLAKTLINDLTVKNNFNLVVKLLCGIGRYREMFYCFEILIKNEAFEALLGQFNDKQTNGLKNAILSYLNEYHPSNFEYYKMTASHFAMFSELAKIYRSNSMEKIQKLLNESQVKVMKSARINTNVIQQIEIPYLVCSSNKNMITDLNEALNEMIHATEMAAADNKIEMSLKLSNFCELIAVQIHLVKIGLETDDKRCPCVVNQEANRQEISQYFANYDLSPPQMMILNKNVDIAIDYTRTIFCRSLIVGDESYLLEFIGRIDLTDAMIENVIKLTQFESITKKQEKVLHDLVMMTRDVGLKFRLASLLGLKGLLQQLLNDEQTYHYLLDSKYGSVEIL